MQKRKSVTISREMYLIIQGQIGNIAQGVETVKSQLMSVGFTEPPVALTALSIEVQFLQHYLPRNPEELQLRIPTGRKEANDGD